MIYSLYILLYRPILLSNETIHLLLTERFETVFLIVVALLIVEIMFNR